MEAGEEPVDGTIHLRVTLPDRSLFAGAVTKVVADGVDGSRGFLPRHVDFVLPLRNGVLSCTLPGGDERFFAVRGGLLVKKGAEVVVATRGAAMAERLEELPEGILQSFATADEHERAARQAAARLETTLLREFLELYR